MAHEEIPKVQSKSINFDEILPKQQKVYIPRMMYSCKRQSFERFVEKQLLKHCNQKSKKVIIYSSTGGAKYGTTNRSLLQKR